MMAAPRLPTFGMYSFLYQASSLTSAGAALPPTVAKRMSGYIVGEWLPHTTIFSMSVTDALVRVASCEMARLWSRRIIEVKAVCGRLFAVFMVISALVLAGLPTTMSFRSRAATASMRLALLGEDLGVFEQQVLALHAGAARLGADQQRLLGVLEGDLRVEVPIMSASSGKAQSSSSIITPLSAAWALSIGSSSICRMTGWSLPSISPLAMRNSRA